MKVIESLISTYPLPDSIFQRVALRRGLDLEAEVTSDIIMSREYRLAEADIKLLSSVAPDVTQGGVSFKLDDKARENMRTEAMSIFRELEDPLCSTPRYGYKGSRL